MLFLNTSFKLTQDFSEKTNLITAFLESHGFEASDCGAGFGYRDVGFETNLSIEEIKPIVEKLLVEFPWIDNISTDDYDFYTSEEMQKHLDDV